MPSTAGRRPPDDGLVALHRARFVEWAPSPVVALAASRDGSVLAVARDDGALELLDTETFACVEVRAVFGGGEGGREGAGAGVRRRRLDTCGGRPSSPAPAPLCSAAMTHSYHQILKFKELSPCADKHTLFSLV
jgi:U3 small nucleolar RNA-associated protein 4